MVCRLLSVATATDVDCQPRALRPSQPLHLSPQALNLGVPLGQGVPLCLNELLAGVLRLPVCQLQRR
ncbi:MAG: hypothetical protein RLZZ387_4904 [Chloroflexota bacterium]